MDCTPRAFVNQQQLLKISVALGSNTSCSNQVVDHKLSKYLLNSKSIGDFGKFHCVPGSLEHHVQA